MVRGRSSLVEGEKLCATRLNRFCSHRIHIYIYIYSCGSQLPKRSSELGRPRAPRTSPNNNHPTRIIRASPSSRYTTHTTHTTLIKWAWKTTTATKTVDEVKPFPRHQGFIYGCLGVVMGDSMCGMICWWVARAHRLWMTCARCRDRFRDDTRNVWRWCLLLYTKRFATCTRNTQGVPGFRFYCNM